MKNLFDFLQKPKRELQAKLAWENFAHKVNGSHTQEKHTKFGRIISNTGPWVFILDTFPRADHTDESSLRSIWYTRMRAPIENSEGFLYTVYSSTFVSEIGKLLGMQDVTIGEPLFDDQFIIKSNDENRAQSILGNEKITSSLMLFPKVQLRIKTENRFLGSFHPDAGNEVYFETERVISDTTRLESLYTMFEEVLYALDDTKCESVLVEKEISTYS